MGALSSAPVVEMRSVWDDPEKPLFVAKIGRKSTEQVHLE
jgi:hypothetical protein